MEAKVKWFNEKRGYGFLEKDDGSTFFLHYKNISMTGFRTLLQGDKVIFDVKETPKGPEATNVMRV